MTRSLCVLLALAVCGAGALDVLAAAKKKARPAPKKRGDDFPAPAAEEPAASFTDNLDQLKEQLGLTDAQAVKLAAMRKKRDTLLARQADLNAKKIEAARTKVAKIRKASERQRMEQQLQKYIERVERSTRTVAVAQERTMFAVLTPEQRAKWNAPLLQAGVEKEMEALGLTDEQKAKIKTICEVQAKRTTAPVSGPGAASAINVVANQVNLRVLTPEQKREYAKSKAARTRSSRRRTRG